VKTDKIAHPPYFIVISGPQSVKLYSIPGSELWVFENDGAYDELLREKGSDLLEIHIPPWSLMICRGDVSHCGAEGEKGKIFLRYHMYILRSGVATPDSINHRSIPGLRAGTPVYEDDEAPRPRINSTSTDKNRRRSTILDDEIDEELGQEKMTQNAIGNEPTTNADPDAIAQEAEVDVNIDGEPDVHTDRNDTDIEDGNGQQ